MRLVELLNQLGCDDDEEHDYVVLVEIPNVEPSEDGWTVKGVRWEHQSREVVLEIDDA